MKKIFDVMETAAGFALGAAGTYLLLNMPSKPKSKVKSKQS